MTNNLRAYVSAASQEIDRAERAIENLRKVGVEVVLDWPKRFREERAKHGARSDATMPPEAMAAIFDEEIVVAGKCDVFLLLHPRRPGDTIVAWAELAGARLASPRPLVVVSRRPDVSRYGATFMDPEFMSDDARPLATDYQVHPLPRAFSDHIFEWDSLAVLAVSRMADRMGAR